jgi:hypothetical protein
MGSKGIEELFRGLYPNIEADIKLDAPYQPNIASLSNLHPYQIQYDHAERPLFSLSEKKIIIRHNFRTSTSASSSSACRQSG